MKSKILDTFEKKAVGTRAVPDFRVGDTVRVHQRIKDRSVEKSKLSKTAKAAKRAQEGEKAAKEERTQIFEGVVLARKHGKGISASFTVRKLAAGVGVEKTYPLHSPTIEKVEVVRRHKVRQAKLYYLRGLRGKKARLKEREFSELIVEESAPEVVQEETVETAAQEEAPAEEQDIKETK